jgi:methionyl-tRNA synthetase
VSPPASPGHPRGFCPGHVVYVGGRAHQLYYGLGYANGSTTTMKSTGRASTSWQGDRPLTFHYRPAMLMSLVEPVPRKVFDTAGCSGWRQDSKSKGNVVDADAARRALRRGRPALFPAARVSLRSDGKFLERVPPRPHQPDLAKLPRQSALPQLAMVEKYFGGVLRRRGGPAPFARSHSMASGLRAARGELEGYAPQTAPSRNLKSLARQQV